MSRLRNLLTLLTAFAVVGFAVPAQAAGPLRIMLEGDSITQGFHRDYTWRYRFDRELTRQGVAHQLVGSRDSTKTAPGFSASKYADPGFDGDHFALGASLLRDHVGWVGAEVAAQDPDVVVLAAGLNDLRWGASPVDLDGRLRTWVAAARDAKPSLRIVVSPVLEAVEASRPWLDERARGYNALAAVTVAQLTTAESPVSMADTTRGWSVAAHTYDDVHPNATGETLIAQRIAEHFHALGILPQEPSIFRYTPWARPVDARLAMRTDRRAALSWDRQGVNSARVSIQRVGYAARVGTYYGGALTTSALVPRATYVFKVSLVRGRASTPWGPAMRVVVRVVPRPSPVSNVVVTAAGVRWSRSALATSYVVKFRKGHAKRWVTRRTAGLSVAAVGVKRAKVWAVNASGRSAMRVGRR